MGINDILKVGNNIKKYRELKGFTQNEMANKLNLNRSTYSNYENNMREPTSRTLEDIALILDIDVMDLLYNTNRKETNKTLINEYDMKENRRRNLKLVIQIQSEINSRITETLNELARNKDTSGKDEVLSMIESIKYKMDDNERFIVE